MRAAWDLVRGKGECVGGGGPALLRGWERKVPLMVKASLQLSALSSPGQADPQSLTKTNLWVATARWSHWTGTTCNRPLALELKACLSLQTCRACCRRRGVTRDRLGDADGVLYSSEGSSGRVVVWPARGSQHSSSVRQSRYPRVSQMRHWFRAPINSPKQTPGSFLPFRQTRRAWLRVETDSCLDAALSARRNVWPQR